MGVLLALYLYIVLDGDVNFQLTIISGLIGYIGRNMQGETRNGE